MRFISPEEYGNPIPYADMACPHTLKGERCPQSINAPGYKVPIMCCREWMLDHSRAYQHALVNEVHNIDIEMLESILRLAKEHNLQVLVNSNSMRNPEKLTHVVYYV